MLCYLPLVRHLPPTSRSTAPGRRGRAGTEPLRSVPELAASYLAAIRRVQPHGPVRDRRLVVRRRRGLRDGPAASDRAGPGRRRPADPHRPDRPPARRPRPAADDVLLDWFFWELIPLERGSAGAGADPAGRLAGEAKLDFIAPPGGDAGVLRPGVSRARYAGCSGCFQGNWEAIMAYRPGAHRPGPHAAAGRRPAAGRAQPDARRAGTLHTTHATGGRGPDHGTDRRDRRTGDIWS